MREAPVACRFGGFRGRSGARTGCLRGGHRVGPYRVRVEPAGLIFAALVVVWLAYLVPWFTTRDHVDPADLTDPSEPLTGTMTVVRRSTDVDVAEPDIDVSTPFTRRAALRDIRRTARLATVRRRRLLIALSIITVVTAGATPFAPWLRWWAALVPAGLLLLSLLIARFSVRAMDHALRARLDELNARWESDTIALSFPMPSAESTEVSIELSVPVVTTTSSLWDPIPVVEPNYMSKPLMPRTVRTIDLSAPVAPMATPPIAEVPVEVVADADASARDQRAVGE